MKTVAAKSLNKRTTLDKVVALLSVVLGAICLAIIGIMGQRVSDEMKFIGTTRQAPGKGAIAGTILLVLAMTTCGIWGSLRSKTYVLCIYAFFATILVIGCSFLTRNSVENYQQFNSLIITDDPFTNIENVLEEFPDPILFRYTVCCGFTCEQLELDPLSFACSEIEDTTVSDEICELIEEVQQCEETADVAELLDSFSALFGADDSLAVGVLASLAAILSCVQCILSCVRIGKEITKPSTPVVYLAPPQEIISKQQAASVNL